MVPIPSVPLPQATWEYVREQPGQPHSGKWDQELLAVGSWTLRTTDGDEGRCNHASGGESFGKSPGEGGVDKGLAIAGEENRAENLRESREICA